MIRGEVEEQGWRITYPADVFFIVCHVVDDLSDEFGTLRRMLVGFERDICYENENSMSNN